MVLLDVVNFWYRVVFFSVRVQKFDLSPMWLKY